MGHQQLDRAIQLPNLGSDDTGCDVLHVDMDAFFAAVELRDRPELRGKPVIVGGLAGRGVVTSATYEARAFGVHSAMPMGRALRTCPSAIVIEPTHGKYGKASAEVMALLATFTPTMEAVSVDEAFLHVAAARRSVGTPSEIARAIRTRVHEELDLPCSVGIGVTTSVAKIASTLAKPDGLLLVPADQTIEFLHALPVQRLWGVGAATKKALAAIGVYTVAELAEVPPRALVAGVGKASAARLTALAAGQEVRPVGTRAAERSISSERTFERDVRDVSVVRRQMRSETQSVMRRVRQAEFVAGTVTVKLRFTDFETVERSHTLPTPTAASSEIDAAVDKLLAKVWRSDEAVRLVGVRVSGLSRRDEVGEQLTLEPTTTARSEAERATDQIVDKFGSKAVQPARLIGRVKPD